MTILSSKSGIISELLIQFEEVRAIPCGRPIGVNLSPSTRATARDRPYYTRACQADAWYSRGDPLRSPWLLKLALMGNTPTLSRVSIVWQSLGGGFVPSSTPGGDASVPRPYGYDPCSTSQYLHVKTQCAACLRAATPPRPRSCAHGISL